MEDPEIEKQLSEVIMDSWESGVGNEEYGLTLNLKTQVR